MMPFKFTAKFLIACLLPAAVATARAQSPRCEDLFKVSAIQELAQLRRAIQETDGAQSVLRSRLNDDFTKKLADVIRERPHEKEKILNELRAALRTLDRNQKEEGPTKKDQRASQKHELKARSLKLSPVLKTEIDSSNLLGHDHSLLTHPKKFSEINEMGVLWSRDGNFVAIRPDDPRGIAENQLIYLYDLQRRIQIPLSSSLGFFGANGHVWVSETPNEFQVIDLNQRKILATYPKESLLEPDGVTDKYAILGRDKSQILKYHSGESHPVGSDFGICESCDVLAYTHEGRIRLVRLSTGKDLSVDLGITDARPAESDQEPNGILQFMVGSQRKFIFLDELVVRDCPHNSDIHLIPGTHVTGQSQIIGSKLSTLFMNHNTGAQRIVQGVTYYNGGPIITVAGSPTTPWMQIDLNLGTEMVIPGTYDSQASARYLYRKERGSGGHEMTVYNLKTHQKFEFFSKGFMRPRFVANSEMMHTSSNVKQTRLFLPENPDETTAVIHHTSRSEPSMSPRGNYVLSEEDGKISVVKVEIQLR